MCQVTTASGSLPTAQCFLYSTHPLKGYEVLGLGTTRRTLIIVNIHSYFHSRESVQDMANYQGYEYLENPVVASPFMICSAWHEHIKVPGTDTCLQSDLPALGS